MRRSRKGIVGMNIAKEAGKNTSREDDDYGRDREKERLPTKPFSRKKPHAKRRNTSAKRNRSSQFSRMGNGG